MIDEFLEGKWPVCKKSHHGTHTKVAGLGVKKPYCLYCSVLLTKIKKRYTN